jgi:hypothetical protein
LIFQSTSPVPGFWLGVAPGAWVSLIVVPSANGPNTAALSLSWMKIRASGSALSVTCRM